MKVALRRKGNSLLVERKQEVLDLLNEVTKVELEDPAAAATFLYSLEARTDSLGIPIVSGEPWGQRLLIKRKAGGMHFSPEEVEQAGHAFRRAQALHNAVKWSEQLLALPIKISTTVLGYRSGGSQLSKARIIEELDKMLQLLVKCLRDMFFDPGFAQALAEMESLAVPQQLTKDGEAVRRSSLELAEIAHEIAVRELEGLRSERALTQRFRAPQTLAVFRAAENLVRSVDVVVQPMTRVPPEFLAVLGDGIREVEPLVDFKRAEEEEDELDDAI